MIPIPDGWSTMTSIDKGLHHNLRRVFRSGVTAEYLARFEPAVLRNLEVYFSELGKTNDPDGWSMAADMRRWSKCRIPFGRITTASDQYCALFRSVSWL